MGGPVSTTQPQDEAEIARSGAPLHVRTGTIAVICHLIHFGWNAEGGKEEHKTAGWKCSPFRYSLFLTTFGFSPTSSGCSSSASATRKPTTSIRVSHQRLCGDAGSHFCQLWSDIRRTALRHLSAESAHDPPRTTCDQRRSVGRVTGRRLSGLAANRS